MKKVKYLASGHGQAPRVRIGGDLYEAGRVYEVTNEKADVLMSKGGFETVVPPKKKESEDL